MGLQTGRHSYLLCIHELAGLGRVCVCVYALDLVKAAVYGPLLNRACCAAQIPVGLSAAVCPHTSPAQHAYLLSGGVFLALLLWQLLLMCCVVVLSFTFVCLCVCMSVGVSCCASYARVHHHQVTKMKMISPSNREVDVGKTLSETEYIGMCRWVLHLCMC